MSFDPPINPHSTDMTTTPMPDSEPLIHTIRGNLPVSSLKFSVAWRVETDFISISETYTDADGVVVRQDAHVCALKGANLESTTADL